MDEAGSQATRTLWVPMVDPEIVKQLRVLSALGWGKKRIARELGIARNSVRRYLREGAAAETQARPGAWTLDAEQQAAARTLLDGAAAGNGVVVQRLLALAEQCRDDLGDTIVKREGKGIRRAGIVP